MNNLIGSQPHRPAVGLALNVDMESMLYDLNSSFNPLHRDCLMDYHVTALDAGKVCMSVIMPRGMLRSFTTLLESMGGFFRFVDNRRKSTEASARVLDLDRLAERDRVKQSFQSEVCSLYDKYVGKGYSRSEAVKAVNRTLKAQNNPWANLYMIENVLRSAGRFKRSCNGKEGKTF